jgi:hypothetical protein
MHRVAELHAPPTYESKRTGSAATQGLGRPVLRLQFGTFHVLIFPMHADACTPSISYLLRALANTRAGRTQRLGASVVPTRTGAVRATPFHSGDFLAYD